MGDDQAQFFEQAQRSFLVPYDQVTDYFGLSQSKIDELNSVLDLEAGDLSAIAGNVINGCNPFYRFYTELGLTLGNCGQPELAAKYLWKHLALEKDPSVHSQYLLYKMLSPGETNESILDSHSEWAHLHERPLLTERIFKNDPDPGKKLKIGYLCHFFGGTVMRAGTLEMMRRLTLGELEVYCYSDSEVEQDLLDHANHWRLTADLTDEQLTQKILADSIDVLIEGNGHGSINRMGCIAARSAPVQINWGNYSATSGMETFDYIILDAVSGDPAEDAYYTESLYINPNFIWAANYPNMDFPDVAPPPVLKNGFVTFGYFGATHKLNDATISMWCDILKTVPESKLLLKAAGFDLPLVVKAIKKSFNRFDIDETRIEFRGYSPYRSMLKEYADIDIMLDAFPHSGGSTFLESIWQGTTPVTLKGDRLASRWGATVLNEIGRNDLIAASPDDYKTIAVKTAADTKQITDNRYSLREEMGRSRLCNMSAYANDMETAFREMWQKWCEEQK